VCFFPLWKQTLFWSTVRWYTYTFKGRSWSYSVVWLSLCFFMAFAWGRFLWALRFSTLRLYPLGSGLLHVRNIAMGTDSLVLCVAYMRRNSRKATGTQDTYVCIMVWPKIGLECSIPTVRSWQSPAGGHGSLSLLFMTKLMVWYFVTDTQRFWPYSSLSCAHLCHVTCKLLLWSPLQSHRHGFQWLWWMFCIQVVTRDIYIYIYA
jgi:hypothetical protein